MSHYANIKVVIKDCSSLIKALREIYGQNNVEVYNEPQHLFDWKGQQRPEMANIIVRRKNINVCSNDLGFLKNKNGTYNMIISDYDMNGYDGSKNNVKNIMLTYAENYIKSRYPTKYTVERKDNRHTKLYVRN